MTDLPGISFRLIFCVVFFCVVYSFLGNKLLGINGRRFGANETLNPFGAPEPLSILNPSNFVPKNGIPVVKGLTPLQLETFFRKKLLEVNIGRISGL